ncbi:MAG: 50S ribosomal protein L23 [Candidatus Babeliales bacterium]
MELTAFDIIQGTVGTEKANYLLRNHGQLVLYVHPQANKPMIKQAVEKLFNVKVSDVRVSVRKGKVKNFKRKQTVGKLTKRAIITVKEEYLQEASQHLSSVPATEQVAGGAQ